MKSREDIIAVARGEAPADLILANASIINVFTGQIESGNVAVHGGFVAGVGDYRDARQVLDLDGRCVAPGFIDGHVHLESSMLDVGQYARAIVPRGTLTIVTDLHEIANVVGLKGIRYVLDSARRLPFDLFLMAPSCVPATNLETSGAALDAQALRKVFRWKECIGLGEMMNFPGVLDRDPATLEKLRISNGRAVDGHAPGLTGKDLEAYTAAGIGSDHESVGLAEALEKLRVGMHIMIRGGSSEKNLETLLPLVTNETYRRCMFVVDDRTCVDLLEDGDLDAALRKAIGLGLDPVRAVQMVTINPATYFRLNGLGAVAPGYLANLVVLDDLATVRVHSVLYRGRVVAKEGRPLFDVGRARSDAPRDTVNIGTVGLDALVITAKSVGAGHAVPFHVIEIVPGQIVTKKKTQMMTLADGRIVPDVSRDILKLVVVERHKATGNVGLGLVTGFRLKRGALSSSVAHDSHNIVAVGVDDASIFAAVKEVERLHGGLVAASGAEVLASLPLPVAGLLSEKPLAETVEGLSKLEIVAAQLGSSLPSPFSVLSFLALPVIPELRLTDLGLVDVGQFRIIDPFA
jgi:adenine deaminase